MLVDSPLESARFGLRVGRCAFDEPLSPLDIDRLIRSVSSSAYDVVIVRVPAMARLGLNFARGTEIDVLFAGSDITYEAAVRACAADHAIRTVSEWTQQLEDLVRDIFGGYRNHVDVNPRMDSSLVSDGYAEWASAHVGERNRAVLSLTEADDPIALAAIAFDGARVVVDLAGVVSAARGRGVYARLLDGVEQVAHARGCSSLRITTQVDNIGPQRAWVRRGWLPMSANNTYHLLRRI
jgi:GNAT superfamily N-acetyltransferase